MPQPLLLAALQAGQPRQHFLLLVGLPVREALLAWVFLSVPTRECLARFAVCVAAQEYEVVMYAQALGRRSRSECEWWNVAQM